MIDYLNCPALAVQIGNPIEGSFQAPPSKSFTLRALALAALAEGESRIAHPLDSDDTRHMAAALMRLGVGICWTDDSIAVRGRGFDLAAPIEPIDCGLSGVTIRFLAALAALTAAPLILTGSAPLLRRPIGPLADALTALGARIVWLDRPGYPPLQVTGPLRGGSVEVDASGSSQFLSALLIAAPGARESVHLRVRGSAARPYVAMTAATIREFGVLAECPADDEWLIAPGQKYQARRYDVEYDASAAAHLFALAGATRGRVTVVNAAPDTLQADARFVAYLQRMGCGASREGDALTVTGTDRLLGVELDLCDTPDLTTPMGVLCAMAEGGSRISGVGFVRGHETDRLAATTTELSRLGARVLERPDEIQIESPILHGDRVRTYHDHRMAMSFASAGTVPGLIIEDPGCVTKTYRDFWRDIARVGVELTPVE